MKLEFVIGLVVIYMIGIVAGVGNCTTEPCYSPMVRVIVSMEVTIASIVLHQINVEKHKVVAFSWCIWTLSSFSGVLSHRTYGVRGTDTTNFYPESVPW